MQKSLLSVIPFMIAVALSGCNLPSGTPAPIVNATETPTATPLIQVGIESPTFFPPEVLATPTPQNPLVLRPTLCWYGPGPKYDVVSGLKQGERVKLLGQGSIAGWYIVDNPIYHDPCWVQQADLQIEPGTDLLSLQTFIPPPTYTPTKVPTVTPTP